MGKKLAKVKNQIKQDLPKTRKGKIFGIIFAIISPIALGVVGGVVYVKFFVAKTADYSNIDTDSLYINMETVLAKYADSQATGTPVEEALKSYEIVNLAYHNYEQHENSRSFTVGSAVAAIVNQGIRGCSIREGNEYFEESLSKSNMVGVAARMYQHENNTIELHRGEAIEVDQATWGDEHYEYTKEEFINDFGKTPSTSLIYIVSKKTVLANTDTVTKTDEGYTIKMSLNPVKSVVNYVKQMKSISNLYAEPAFDSVNLTFYIDNNLLINKLHIEESYYALKEANLGADTKANVNVYYAVDGGFKIPTLAEAITYPVEEAE
ncbi:MAG: hypothetical protein K5906_04790 [Bacilli bacterium]|nr:hypothetical protein [Bacilli bacterium]